MTNDRPNAPAGGTNLGSPSQDEWLAGVLNAADFGKPEAGAVGSLGRNAYRGPKYNNLDFSFFKNLPLPWFGSRNSNVQIRIEVFNLFNTVNFNNPVANIANTAFGRVQSQRAAREIQLGARFQF